ncbi:MAG TPA: Na+/H+ antiporter [Mycobacteriales bacterium]|nr:Na+/H+ antiporter [Mycobacteriales bacterium]
MEAHVGFAIGALACVLLVRPIASRSGVPAAVLLVVIGVIYGELPGRNITLQPDVVFTLILPPLLYSAALQASLLEIRANLRSVAWLSVGLPLVTALAIGGVLSAAVPGLPFALALAVGAAVAPPDPIAALSIGRRVGLSARLTTLIEGEGLLNDATALTTYQVAIAAAVGGGFSAGHAIGKFALDAVGGFVIGFAIAVLVREMRRRVHDPLVDNGISIGVPFACFIAADAAHTSGVLAVVVAGLTLGHSSSEISSGPARLQSRAVWGFVDFLLEGFIFLLIGQQLPRVVSRLDAYDAATLAAAAGAAVGLTLAIRPLWLLGYKLVPAALKGSAEALRIKEIVALSWVGTRGVISLAAAFSLPLTAHGSPLPKRDLLLFCAYTVVLVTLVGQGLTLGPLLRWLRLPSYGPERQLRLAEARLAAAQAGAERVEELILEEDVPPVIADRARASARAAIEHYTRRRGDLNLTDLGAAESVISLLARLRRLRIEAAREELVRWRDAGRLSDRNLRLLDRELDLEEGPGPM